MLIVFSPSLFFVKIWKFHDTRLAVISLLPNVERKVSPFWKACLIRITKKSPESQNGDFPPFFFFVYKNLSKKWVFFTTWQILASLVVATIFLCCKYLENIRNYRNVEVLSFSKWPSLPLNCHFLEKYDFFRNSHIFALKCCGVNGPRMGKYA